MYQNEYLETKVMTAAPYQLHLIVLDAALKYAKLGREMLEEKNYEVFSDSLTRSRDFMTELLVGLDPEQAPEMVQSLKVLFSFVYRNLALADIQRDAQRLQDGILILERHRQTWVELLDRLPAEALAVNSAAASLESNSWEG